MAPRGPVLADTMEIVGIPVTIKRQMTSRISVRVDSLTGEVRVGAHYSTSDEEITQFLEERLIWLLDRLADYDYQRAIAPKSCWKYGEQAFLFGAERTLREWEPHMRNLGCLGRGVTWDMVDNEVFLDYLPPDPHMRPDYILDGLLESVVQDLIVHHYQTIQRRPSEVRYRQMRSRWGSCNRRSGKVTLNRQLVHLPVDLIEYVVVHEMTHLWEGGHQAAFQRRMDQYLPNWRSLRRDLNDPYWMHIT